MLSNFRALGRIGQFKYGLSSLSQYNFSAAETMQTNFVNFRKEYDEYVNSFSAKLEEVEKNNQRTSSKPVDSSYHHPYDNDHHPLNFSPVKSAELFHDFIGPEQVSPHYENFLVSRKYLMVFWGGFFAINVGIATVDLQWIMKSALMPWIFYFSYLYWYMEGKNSFLKPLLNRFYRRAAANECFMFESYYHENIENKLRELIRITQGQLDYWNIHNNYKEVKAESVNNFLANQYMALQHHIADRAENILKSAAQFEAVNKQQHVGKVLTSAVNQLEQTLESNREEVEADIFERALEGLRKGQMNYGQDLLLTSVLNKFQENVAQLSNLSEAEQQKLVELTQQQIAQIQSADEIAKQNYLSAEPEGIDQSLRQYEHVARQLEGWGK